MVPAYPSFTVGWICALSTEQVAATLVFDENYGLPVEPLSAGDTNSYRLGRIGPHRVVVAVLPDGERGTDSAAAVATNMLNTFCNVKFGLSVGVGGGAPTDQHDIRLGDVVISSPGNGTGGVFEYDFGRTIQNRPFEYTRHLNMPPIALRTAVSTLRTDYELHGHTIYESIDELLQSRERDLCLRYSKPHYSTDRLFRSDVIHSEQCGGECTAFCGTDGTCLVRRPARDVEDDDPAIFYGVIASANSILEDACIRDKLAKERGVMCFETEAAGLMNRFPCIVIRGIGSYSDTHNSSQWQGYAALTASVCARDLLRRTAPTRVHVKQHHDDPSDVLLQLLRALQNERQNPHVIEQASMGSEVFQDQEQRSTPLDRGDTHQERQNT